MLRGLFTFALLVAVTLLLGVLAILANLLKPGGHMTMRFGKLWSRIMLRAVGARVTYEDLRNADARLPCVFVANHQSNVDIWALANALPMPTRFVAKQSLFRVPILGWAMSTGGFIAIDRTHRNRAIESLRLAAKEIRGGQPVILFPEGTRSRNGRLQPFKKGPFHLALRAEVPVVPVAITGSGAVMPARSLRVRPGPVRVRFLPPVEVSRFLPNDYEGLRTTVHEILERALAEDAGRPSPA